MSGKTDDRPPTSAPRPLAGYIDPAWRLRSRGDAGIRRVLGALLESYLKERRVDLAATGNGLVIVCRDRGCATELRFLQREILKTLKDAGYTAIEQVRVVLSVADPAMSEAAEPVAPRTIPATARQALLTAAAGVDDQRLAEALLRLARAGG